jgi:hypothetical protein
MGISLRLVSLALDVYTHNNSFFSGATHGMPLCICVQFSSESGSSSGEQKKKLQQFSLL